MPATITGTFAATVNVAAYTNSYMDCTVGTASCPDQPALPAQCTFLAKLRGPAVGTKTICSQALNTGNQMSFGIRRGGAQIVYTWYPTGTTTGSSRAPTCPAPTQADEYVGIAIDRAVNTQVYTSTDGVSWSGQTALAGNSAAPIDSTAKISIGTSEYTIGLVAWDSRIYWVELRTGISPTGGSVLWRFDANEHVTGTSWTDPRGITWTLTNASAIVHV